MITCRDASELHTEAAEGALKGAKKVFYDVHMTICGACKRYRAQLLATTQILENLPKETPPPGLLDLLAEELPKRDPKRDDEK
jgi:hypothetical protein